MLSFYWFNPFLEARAEIKKIFRWVFGSNENKKICLQNYLTFTSERLSNHTTTYFLAAYFYCLLISKVLALIHKVTKYLVIKKLLLFLGTIHLHMNHVTTIKHKLLQKISSDQDLRHKLQLLFTKIIKLLWLEIIHLHQLPVLLVSTDRLFLISKDFIYGSGFYMLFLMYKTIPTNVWLISFWYFRFFVFWSL